MKFLLISATILLSIANVSAAPVGFSKRDVDPALVPEFGFESGVNPTGTGDCDGAINGADGKPVKVPCSCPPDREEFLRSLNANVNAGFAVNNPSVKLSFPADNSKDSQRARLHAATVTLQNLKGPGVGCPNASTTFGAQLKAIDAAPDNGPAPAPAPAPAPEQPAPETPAPSNPGAPSDADVARLAPSLGFSKGVNPTGTGDCDGAINGANGQPIKIPCACPPDQDVYIAALQKNVAAGIAVNNPTVKVSFPLGDSKADKSARLNAAAITLQNLNGPGKGCPVVSTTFPLQQKEIDALPA